MDKKLKILIVRLSAIGDVVHSLPILHSLRQKFPDAFIGWVVEDRASEVLVGNPLLDKVYIMPKKKWKEQGFSAKTLSEFSEFIGEIRSEKFDIAIDLQELFKSGFITYLSGTKRRIAHDKTREFADIFVNEKLPYHDIFDPNKPIIERYLEPAAYLGAPIDKIQFSLPPVSQKTKDYVDSLLENINKSKPIIVFSPATIWPTKHWFEEYWSELLEKLAPENNIIFVGSPNDNELIERITSNAATESYISLAGKTKITDLIEVFNRSDILVAPDTGPTHIANATGKPIIITLFGSTGVKRSAPYGEKHAALSAKLSCQPCFERICPRKDSKMECMKKIIPYTVLNIVNEKLKHIIGNVI